jgi:hypothetical protein
VVPVTAPGTVSDVLTGMLRSRVKWDEAPGLYFIYEVKGAVRISRRSVVPEPMWAERPPETLARFAFAMEHAPPGSLASIAPEGFMGAAFRCETWSVIMPPGADAATEAHARELQDARMLSLHPQRVESRFAWAVTRDGTHHFASQVRGEDEVTAGTPDEPAEGLIPSSLARIVRALAKERA